MSKGDIGSVIDSLRFDNTIANWPDIIHVAGEVFCAIYQGLSNEGYAKTFTIDKDGNVGSAVLATFAQIIGITNMSHAHIKRIPNTDNFVIIHTNHIASGGGGTARVSLTTITINPDGTFGSAVLDTQDVGSGSSGRAYPDLIHISGDVWATLHDDDQVGALELETWTISSLGIITNTRIDSLVIDDEGGSNPTLAHVSGTMYAAVYSTAPSNETVATFVIENDGQIAAAVTDLADFSVTSLTAVGHHRFLKVGGTTYVFAFPDNSTGRVVTVDITDAGAITTSFVSSLIFETTSASSIDLVEIATGLFAAVYSGVNDDGFIKTFLINKASGVIGPVLDTLEFDTAMAQEAHVVLVPLSDGKLAIVSARLSVVDKGELDTVGVTIGRKGRIWIEGRDFHYIDENGVERTMTGTAVDNPDGADVKSVMGL